MYRLKTNRTEDICRVLFVVCLGRTTNLPGMLDRFDECHGVFTGYSRIDEDWTPYNVSKCQ